MEDSQIVDLYWERSENAIVKTSEKYGNTYHILEHQAKPTLLQFCLMTTDARENDSWASKVLLIRIKLKSCFK